MAAVVTGLGFGLYNSSNNILGLRLSGRTGQDVLGQAGNGIFVNAATGNMILQAQDVFLSGRGADLFDQRTYNSLPAIRSGMGDELGAGWIRDGEVRLSFSGTQPGVDGTVTRTVGDGAQQTFTWNSTLKLYTSDDGTGARDTLTFDSTKNQWTYTEGSSQAKEVYEQPDNAPKTVWRLLSRTDVTGNTITYQYEKVTYDNLWRITGILDASGQKIQFSYNGSRISGVSVLQLTVDANGRAIGSVGTALALVTYGYDNLGRITTVTTDLTPDVTSDSKVFTTTYAYVTNPNLDPMLIASIRQSDGTSVSFDYYDSGTDIGKVKTVTTGTNASAMVQRFEYQSGQTTVTEADGQKWIYKYDSAMRLTEIDAPAPGGGQIAPVTIYQYSSDGRGNLAQITQVADGNPADNRVIRYEYDDRDNRTLQRDSLGNTVVWAYDGNNQLISETHNTGFDSKGLDPDDTGTISGTALTTRYIYDLQSRLRFVISAEGRVTESRYETGGFGQLTRTIAYAGGRFDPTTLQATGQEAQLATWAAGQDQKQTELTQYGYDLRGNLAAKTSYATVDANGVGAADSSTVTNYIYDGRSALLQTIAMRGASRTTPAVLTSFGYDGLGREITQTNAGGTTNTLYDDANGAIQITNTGSKLQERRTFDSAGRLTSVAQSDTTTGSSTPSRTTEYLYDSGGRVQVVQTIVSIDTTSGVEALGARSFYFYDADGRIQYAVDATGAVCGYAYDGGGMLLTQTCYATPADTTGWVTATIVTQPDGKKKTVYAINKTALTVGTDVKTVTSNDRAIVNQYDAAARHTTTTDGEGTVTTTNYDGASRVTSVKVGTTAAGFRTTQYFYDEDGNQVGVIDPLGYLTEKKYSAAGRLVESVRYKNKSATTGDPSTPVWNGVADQSASIGRLFVYHLPAAYDADGDAITYSPVGSLPSWLKFDKASLTLSGTPPQGTAATTTITLKASDGQGSTPKTKSATFKITLVNAPPDWGNIPDTSVEVNTANFEIALPDATDFESSAAQLVYSVSQTPHGMTFDPASHKLTGTPDKAGTFIITATVKDSGTPPLSTQRTFTVFVTNKGPGWTPDLSGLPHAFRTLPFDYTVPAAVDPENQALTYKIISGPSWLTLADTTKPRLTGTPPLGTPAALTPILLEAKDESGATVLLGFSMVVEGAPPTWSGPLTISLPAGNVIANDLPSKAVDPDGGTIRYDIVGELPGTLAAAGLTIDHATGRLTTAASTNPSDVNTYTIRVRASDTETPPKYIERDVTISLTNTAPVYVGGLASTYSDWQFNPKTVLIFYSDFHDINGPVTLSVDGATPGQLPFAFPDPNHTVWVPGLYFDPLDNVDPIFGHPIHGSADDTTDQDTGERPMGVLTWYDPTAAAGSTKTVTIHATDQQGASVARNVTFVVQALPPPPLPPPPVPPPPGPPRPPGSPPIRPLAAIPGGGLPTIPTAPIEPAPTPVLGEAPEPASTIAPAPAPPLMAASAITPTIDVLANVRPADLTGLHSYFYNDDEGRLTGIVDDKGFLTATAYDDGANTQQTIRYETPVTVSAGDTLTDLQGRAGVTDTETITYDSFGRVSTSKAFDGTVTRFEYDVAGRVAREIHADGTSNQRATRLRYDVFGEVTGTVSGEGEATLSGTPTQAQIDTAITTFGVQSFYDALGRKIRTTDANNHSTYFYYDTENRLTNTVDAAGDVSATHYNAFGQADSVLRYATALTPAQLANVTGGASGTLALPAADTKNDQLTQFTFDRRGLLRTTTLPIKGFTTTDTYTVFGQLDSETRTLTVDDSGNPTTTTRTQLSYDLDGRLILTTGDYQGLDDNSQVFYDAYGRVIRSVDSAGNSTTTSYQDENGQDTGRVIQVTDPLNHVIRDDYDAFGRLHIHTDANGKKTTYDYNLSARTTKVTTPEGVQLLTTKNEFGETVSVKDGRGNTTSYTYDKNGNLKTLTDAAGKTTTNFYDPSARLEHIEDARGTVTKLVYDAVDRVFTRTVDPSGLNLTTTYAYDAFGRVSTVVEGTRTTSYEYDQQDRLTKTIVDPSGLKLTTAFKYDGDGHVTRLARGGGSTPEQEITVYVFDKLGRRIKEIVAPSAESSLGAGSTNNRNLTKEFRYDSANRLSRTIDENGFSTWYVYDAADELRFTINALGEVSENTYDPKGQLIKTRQYATRLSASTVAGFGDTIASLTAPATSTDDARTYFAYDDDGQLRFAVQALVGDGSGKWAVNESRHDANGNVIESRRYDLTLTNARITADDTTSSPGLSVAEVSAELVTLGYKDTALGASTTDETTLASVERTRYAYDLVNRLRFTVNAVGDVSEREYDEVGNVVRTTGFAGVPTLTDYSESGISGAVDRKNADNRTTYFAFDRAGRLAYTVRVLAIDANGNATRQLVSKLSYDALGNVTLMRDFAGTLGALADHKTATLDQAINGNSIDGASIAKDPRNRTTAFAYDAAGQRVYAIRVLAVDANGLATKQLISKTSYDGAGHVTETTQFAKTFDSLADYTLGTLDTATKAPIAAADPQNHTTAHIFNAAGREIYTIRVLAVDSTGKSTQQLVTRNTYNAKGQLVQVTSFASVMKLADYQQSTLDLAVASNTTDQDRNSYFVYDAADRQIYDIDTLGPDATGKVAQRVSQSTFDALGRLVLSTEYAAPFHLTDMRKAAIDTAVGDTAVTSNPLNRTTAYAYDAASERVYTVRVVEADSTGKPTRQSVSQASFDAMGRLVKTVDFFADNLTLANYKKTTLDSAVGASAVKNNVLNRVTAYTYDAADRQVYVAQLQGAGQYLITRRTFNAFGEAAETKSYTKTVALADFLKKTVDSAVAATAVANNIDNRTSMCAYDTLGREVYKVRVLTVNSSGTPTQHVVTKLTYDAFDDLIQSTIFATPMALADYKPATLDAAVTQNASAQDRATRQVFDTAGRQRFVLGADGSLSETLYDGTDQVTESRRYATSFTFDPTKADLESYWVGLRGTTAKVGDGTTRGVKYGYDQAGRLLTTTDALNVAETNTYDAVGNRTTFTDKNKGVWTYTFDAAGRVRTQLSPSISARLTDGTTFTGGLKTTYDYDVFGGTSTMTEAANTNDARATSYTYDNLGRQKVMTLPGWYDPASGKVIQVSDPSKAPAGSFQRTVENSFDAFGDLVSVQTRTGASSFTTQYHAYNTLGQLTYDIDELNGVTGYGYNSFGEQTTVTRFSTGLGVGVTPGPTNTTFWVPADVAAKVTGDAKARTLTMIYDLLGRKKQVTGQSSSNYFAGSTAAAKNATTISQPPGGAPPPKTTYDYNVFGELVHEAQQVDASTTRETWHYYDLMGHETLTVDPARFQTVRTYDALGNPKMVIESAQPGQVGTLTTPPPLLAAHILDNTWVNVDPNDRVSTFGYDALDRQTSVARKNFRYTNAQGQDVNSGSTDVVVSSTTFDNLDRIKTQTDVLNNVTMFDYDALGHLIKLTEPTRDIAAPQVALPFDLNSTPVALDPFLSRKTVTPATSYTLDAFGQVVAQSRAAFDVNGGAQVGDATTSERGYDVAGNLTFVTDGNHGATLYRVDYAGRTIESSVSIDVMLGDAGGLSQTIVRHFVFDAAGRQTDVIDFYSDSNNLAQQSGTHREFNSFGEVKAEYREWGTAATDVASLARAIVAAYDYDKNGKQIQKTAGDGITKYYYDLAGDQTRQEQYALKLNPDGTVLLNTDGTANIDSTVAARITEVGYDSLARATVERLPAVSARRAGTSSDVLITPILQMTYDRWGNLTQRIQGGYALNSDGTYQGSESRTWNYTYNSNNQVITQVNPTVAATRADGSTYQATVTHESHYDIAGRLVTESDVAAGVATPLMTRHHEYDKLGELSADVDATGVRIEYIYDERNNRVGTLNVGNGKATDAIVRTVFVDGFDKNGNQTSHSILRTDANNPYVSGSGQTPVLYVLKLFKYDQENRQVGNADVMHDLHSNVFWNWTRYDERNLVTASRTPNFLPVDPDTRLPVDGALDVGLTTSYAYDQFGNRILQLDNAHNGQTWSYRTDGFIAGQLKFSTVGTGWDIFSPAGGFATTNRVTTYAYNGFGQTNSETYTGAVMSSGMTNSRSYSYYENGALKQVADTTSQGTIGPIGNDDYFSSTDSTTYDYSVNGERAQTTFTISSAYDDATYADDGSVISVSDTPISISPTTRVTQMSYDAQGRLIDVKEPAAQNLGHASISDLVYQYDERGNRRRILAIYQRPGDSTSLVSDKWYDFDEEGRLTVVDGQLDNGVIDAHIAGATEVSYDALGRRYTATKFVGDNDSNNGAPAHEIQEHASWTEYDSQKYNYNDLGYLKKTWQSIIRRDATITTTFNSTTHVRQFAVDAGAWFVLEDRTLDVRGSMTHDDLYYSISASPVDYGVDFNGNERSSQEFFSYLADGRLARQEILQYDTNGANIRFSDLFNTYDDHTGLLDHYNYRGGTNVFPPEWDNNYQYSYTMEFGGYREKTITVTPRTALTAGNPLTGKTTNQYDSRGNMVGQIITNPGQTRSRTFYYDNNGQIISKSETLEVTGQAAKFGNQDFVYVDGHQVAVLGTGTLDAAQFINDFTPVTTGTGSTPGSYVVNSGDSLASIAQNVLGDASLWYLIADANSVSYGPSTPLPSSEIGRTYRIPSVITAHSNATTFTPYNPNSITADSGASPYLPPPPGPSCGEQAAMIAAVAVVVAVSVVVSVYTAGALSGVMGPVIANMIGAVAASAASQGVGMALGVQKDFSTDQLVEAGVGGFVGGFVSAAEAGAATAASEAGQNSIFTATNGVGSFTNSYANIVQGAAENQLSSLLMGHGITEKGGESSLFALGSRLGANALFGGSNSQNGFSWSSLFQGIVGSGANAANPFQDQPFSWANIASQAVNGAVAVGAAYGADWLVKRTLGSQNEPEQGPNRRPRLTEIRGPVVAGYASYTDGGVETDSIDLSSGAQSSPAVQTSRTSAGSAGSQGGSDFDPANLQTYSDAELRKLGMWQHFENGKPTSLFETQGADGGIQVFDAGEVVYVEGKAPPPPPVDPIKETIGLAWNALRASAADGSLVRALKQGVDDMDFAQHARIMAFAKRAPVESNYALKEALKVHGDDEVLKQFGFEPSWRTLKTRNTLLDAADAYDNDYYKRHVGNDRPSSMSDGTAAAALQRREEKLNEVYTNSTASPGGAAGAAVGSIVTDDPEKLAGWSGAGDTANGMAAARFLTPNGAPEVVNEPFNPYGAWRYSGPARIVDAAPGPNTRVLDNNTREPLPTPGSSPFEPLRGPDTIQFGPPPGDPATSAAAADSAVNSLLYDSAVEARDETLRAFGLLSRNEAKQATTVLGGYNQRGEVAVGTKWSDEGPFCAEDVLVDKLGGDTTSVIKTPAVRPRNLELINVCERCQTRHPLDTFGPGTQFDVPQLEAGPPGDMLREAVGQAQLLQGNSLQKADRFADLTNQIGQVNEGWSATRSLGADGSHIFAGSLGHSVVIAPDGSFFRGNITTPGQFALQPNGSFLPTYDQLTPIGGSSAIRGGR